MKRLGRTALGAGLVLTTLATGCLGSWASSKSGPGSTDGGVGATCGTTLAPGHYALRRLTNNEYTNTVQDLFFTKTTPGATFEGTSTGKSGYSNDSAALTLSSPLFLQYYNAAEALATEVVASKGQTGGAYATLVSCSTTSADCAKTVVTALATRAFRRPATADEVTQLLAIFQQSGDFDTGLSDSIVSVLLNPNFLMIPVVNDKSTDPTAVFALDGYQLASRLSYDLWQTTPDATLLAAAADGSLTTPSVLAAQVKRMLADTTRVRGLEGTLRDEYAQLAPLAGTDFTSEGQTNSLRDSMIGETDAFFTDLVGNDRSPLTILSSDQSFVNQELATFYGVPFTSGTDPSTFVPVNANRIGLGSQASVLANTSGGDVAATNPIKRGHWIVDQLYCTPPPPPTKAFTLPPPSGPDSNIRETLATHVADPSCAGCHILMDSFGLGAEDYDIFGKARTTYTDGSLVDASGSLPDGLAWTASNAMYAGLVTDQKALSCIPQQLMSYALSRPLGSSDDTCVATAIAQQSVTATGTFSDMMTGIVQSKMFMYQTGEAQ